MLNRIHWLCCSRPVPRSRADTWTIPLASMSKETSIWGTPRGAGGIPTCRCSHTNTTCSYTQCLMWKILKSEMVKFFHTHYRALGPEPIPVYRQSARRWREVNHAIDLAVGCHYFLPSLRLPPQLSPDDDATCKRQHTSDSSLLLIYRPIDRKYEMRELYFQHGPLSHEGSTHQMLMRVNIRCHTCLSFSQSVLVFYQWSDIVVNLHRHCHLVVL